MPTAAEHEIKYQDNLRTLHANGGLDQTSECWAAVIAFYATLHMIEHLAAEEGKHLRFHTGRNSREEFLRNHSQHHVIFRDYLSLRHASEQARYESLSLFQSNCPRGSTRRSLINGRLKRIEKYVANYLAGKNPPPIPPAAGS